MANIEKVGLFYVRNNRVLLCRKKTLTSLLILPGGKLEPGETAEECLERECREELGDVSVRKLQRLGTYESPAAGEPNKTVTIHLFKADLIGTPKPQAEIAELVWFAPGDDPALLAPSLRYVVFPDLRLRGVIDQQL